MEKDWEKLRSSWQCAVDNFSLADSRGRNSLLKFCSALEHSGFAPLLSSHLKQAAHENEENTGGVNSSERIHAAQDDLCKPSNVDGPGRVKSAITQELRDAIEDAMECCSRVVDSLCGVESALAQEIRDMIADVAKLRDLTEGSNSRSSARRSPFGQEVTDMEMIDMIGDEIVQTKGGRSPPAMICIAYEIIEMIKDEIDQTKRGNSHGSVERILLRDTKEEQLQSTFDERPSILANSNKNEVLKEKYEKVVPLANAESKKYHQSFLPASSATSFVTTDLNGQIILVSMLISSHWTVLKDFCRAIQPPFRTGESFLEFVEEERAIERHDDSYWAVHCLYRWIQENPKKDFLSAVYDALIYGLEDMELVEKLFEYFPRDFPVSDAGSLHARLPGCDAVKTNADRQKENEAMQMSSKQMLVRDLFTDGTDQEDDYYKYRGSTKLRVGDREVTCIRQQKLQKIVGHEGATLSFSLFGIHLTIPPKAASATSKDSLKNSVFFSLYISETPVYVDNQMAYVGFVEFLPHQTGHEEGAEIDFDNELWKMPRELTQLLERSKDAKSLQYVLQLENVRYNFVTYITGKAQRGRSRTLKIRKTHKDTLQDPHNIKMICTFLPSDQRTVTITSLKNQEGENFALDDGTFAGGCEYSVGLLPSPDAGDTGLGVIELRIEQPDFEQTKFVLSEDHLKTSCPQVDKDCQLLADSSEIKPSSETDVIIYINKRRVTCIQKGTASGQIGVSGGNLALLSYGLSLTIPPGAITTAPSLDVRLSLFVSEETVDIEGRATYIGFIELLPHKTDFAKPVILRYELKHHHRLDVNQRIEAEYGLFYGEGTDPSKPYDFIGCLGLASRLASHKGIMNFHLQDDCLELSALSFSHHCCLVQINGFGITICFFVRSKGNFDGERKWDIRIIISCSCRENLENIQKDQKTIGYAFVDKSPLHCQMPSFISRHIGSQRLEFSLGNEDHKSNFSLLSKKQFSGKELRYVVEGEDFRYLQRNCTVKCQEQLACVQPVTIAYKYYESSPISDTLLSEDDVSFWLESEASSDYRSSDSDFPSTDLQPPRSRRRRAGTAVLHKQSDAIPAPVSVSANSNGDTENADRRDVPLRVCSASESHAASSQRTGNSIAKRLDSKLVSIKRKPKPPELLDVSKRLSNDQWKNVARRLFVAEHVVEHIIGDESRLTEQAYQMLTMWIEDQDDEATVGRLCEALIEEGRTDIAREVFQQKTSGKILELAV